MRTRWLFFVFLPLCTVAQKKQITLEDIFIKGTFRGEYFPGFEAENEDTLFQAADIKTDKGIPVIIDDYTLSADKKRILFFNGSEPIYRRSSKSTVYVYDRNTKKTRLLHEGKVLHPTFSPNGNQIAYVFENNLYLYDIPGNTTKAVTTDGKWNFIINGKSDWVYEEEFEFSRAFEWSPDGAYIAYYRFDESKVKEYNITYYNNQYNTDYRYKYPKAGDENSRVEIHLFNTATGQDIKASYPQGDIYIPRIKWTQSNNKLVVFWMNRHQNELKLLLTDAATGAATTMYEETNKYYMEINDNWQFLKDGKQFLFTSERNGYNQVYLYSIDGKTKKQLSTLKSDVAEINGVDEDHQLVYYTLAYPTPMDRNLFVSSFDGKITRQLTTESGWHRIQLNSNFTQFYDYYSNINTPQKIVLYQLTTNKKNIAANLQQIVNENTRLKKNLLTYDISRAQLIKVPNKKGDSLNAWILKPSTFDSTKKYPLLFCNYGGPGSQQVANRFGVVTFWHQLMAEKGFIVVSVDNTGTGFRGEEFKKKTYLQLGKLEIEDQIDAARFFASLSFIDKDRIGHWGWSFGGFMSALAITKGTDIFKAAVAVAPVTSWRFYDNIYTERFMRTPQENPEGYDHNSPINFVEKIKGNFLIIHGTADDNVHFQNSVQMVEAMIQHGISFESAYYPNKVHSITGGNTTFHLWSKMTEWLLKNLRDDSTPLDELSNKRIAQQN